MAPRTRQVGHTIDIHHRSPPHSVEAEQGVLGSMLISPRETIGECIERIGPEFFYSASHQTIYELLVELWRAGKTIDLITFTQELRDRKLMPKIGGEGTCERLMNFVPTAANISHYIDILVEKYILRSIISSSTESIQRAYEAHDDVEALLADHERRALAIRPGEGKPSGSGMKDIVMDAIERIEKQFDNKGAISGLATGFIELDRMTSGLHPAEMIVIAGRPSMGKTAFAMNIAEYVAVQEKHFVGVFSLEMSKEQLGERLLCSRARVNMQKVRDGFLGERDFPSLTAAASKLTEAKIIIDDGIMNMDVLLARGRRWKLEHNIKLLIVDYLQLLSASGFQPKEREREVTFISKSFKRLAKELQIPVIVIAQLNRQPEARAGGKPRLSDLRESGSIEQDADVVALLWRQEVYAEDEEQRAEMCGEAELIIAKQRSGPIGQIPLTFLKEFTRFEDRARNVLEEESW